MPMTPDYAATEPTRAEIDALEGPTVLEFGSPWCGYCRRTQPLLAKAFADHPDIHHIKVEDGPGRRLGRSFGVKLWPTLVFLREGEEIERLVRPGDAGSIAGALVRIEDTIDGDSGTG